MTSAEDGGCRQRPIISWIDSQAFSRRHEVLRLSGIDTTAESDTIKLSGHVIHILEGESSRIRSTNGMLDDQELQVGYMYDVFNKRTNQ